MNGINSAAPWNPRNLLNAVGRRSVQRLTADQTRQTNATGAVTQAIHIQGYEKLAEVLNVVRQLAGGAQYTSDKFHDNGVPTTTIEFKVGESFYALTLTKSPKSERLNDLYADLYAGVSLHTQSSAPGSSPQVSLHIKQELDLSASSLSYNHKIVARPQGASESIYTFPMEEQSPVVLQTLQVVNELYVALASQAKAKGKALPPALLGGS